MRKGLIGPATRRTCRSGAEQSRVASAAITGGGRAAMVLMVALALIPGTALGADWAIQPTAGAEGMNGRSLSSVSCVSSMRCVAVGSASGSVLAETWNGIGWILMPVSGSAGEQPTLASVSCVSATDCVAVGSTGSLPGGGQSRSLAETWNGTSWTVMSVPDVGELSAVSCTSATACVAVGTQARVERWDGSNWKVQRTPKLAALTDGSLLSVSCVSASACTAVGGIEQAVAATNSAPLAERWNGKRWSIESVPHPAAALLQGVSCTSRTNCVAVGTNITPITAAAPPVAEHWNGRTWKSAHIPSVPKVIANLTGVSCASRNACTAVGTVSPGISSTHFKRELLSYRWNGRSWVAGHASEPRGGVASLSSVSCSAPADCTAVGQHRQGDSESALAERERA